jgi:hypothetical protein
MPAIIAQIAQDLILYKNFEKTICYQYSGVFNDPGMSIRIGELSSTKYFLDYQKYIRTLNVNK